MTDVKDYLRNTLPELWSIEGFVDWCASCERFGKSKQKIMDYIKKELESIVNNNITKGDTQQKALDLYNNFQVRYYEITF